MGKKVLAAMSGGVDSSVAVYLLQNAGYDCIGVTMKLFDSDNAAAVAANAAASAAVAAAPRREKSCCSLADVNDASDVAYTLHIPHYIKNFTEEFSACVIERFVNVYEAGGTPNPCIDCNRFIKFKHLLHFGLELGAEFIATGHYARIEKSEKNGSRYILKRARDSKKDKSYFLYHLTQDELSRTLFPLGALTKEEVRCLAKDLRLVNASKGDSQDLCFVPDGDYCAFLERYRGKPYKHGSIIDSGGNVIGEHKGFVKYTIGQRRGLGVSSQTPLYVTGKDGERNTVTLGDETKLYARALDANDINLIAAENIASAINVTVKTRYMQKEQRAAVVQTSPDTLHIEFAQPVKALSCGQAAVIYDGETVIGGGTISRVY